jgi:hypothetical protein
MKTATRNIIRLCVVALLVAAWVFYLRWQHNRILNEGLTHRDNCVRHLRGLAAPFQEWALEHHEQFPFNVSTNSGGTLELCQTNADGFVANAALVFQALTNTEALTTPRLLICPKDRAKKPAPNFRELKPENVTYRVHVSPNVNMGHPKEILVVCPIDGNTLYCDGTIVDAEGHEVPFMTPQ